MPATLDLQLLDDPKLLPDEFEIRISDVCVMMQGGTLALVSMEQKWEIAKKYMLMNNYRIIEKRDEMTGAFVANCKKLKPDSNIIEV